MKQGSNIAYSGAKQDLPPKRIRAFCARKNPRFDSPWTSDAYGPDALTPLFERFFEPINLAQTGMQEMTRI